MKNEKNQAKDFIFKVSPEVYYGIKNIHGVSPLPELLDSFEREFKKHFKEK